MRSASPLFPEFERFVAETGLLSRAKGSLQVKLNRILGKGKTKGEGLDLPPAPFERKMELTSLNLPTDTRLPVSVEAEIGETRQNLEEELRALGKLEGVRRLATQTIKQLPVPGGLKDDNFFAGHLVLVQQKKGTSWSWCLTRYYPLVAKIPPDLDYLRWGYEAAEKMLKELIMPPEVFESKLRLAWSMARQFSPGDDVLVVEVAKMFKVAGQREKFWKTPKKSFFVDLPEANFIVNLINWRRQLVDRRSPFELVPATVNQAHGPNARVFFLPLNPEGTQVRPIIYLRRID
jgi:hypothetical protein